MKKLRCINKSLSNTEDMWCLDNSDTMLNMVKDNNIFEIDDNNISASMFYYRGYSWEMSDFKETHTERLIGGKII